MLRTKKDIRVYDIRDEVHRSLTREDVSGEKGICEAYIDPRDPDYKSGGASVKFNFDLETGTYSKTEQIVYSSDDSLVRWLRSYAVNRRRQVHVRRKNLIRSLKELESDSLSAEWEIDEVRREIASVDRSVILAAQHVRKGWWRSRGDLEIGKRLVIGPYDVVKIIEVESLDKIIALNEELEKKGEVSCRPYVGGPDNPGIIHYWIVLDKKILESHRKIESANVEKSSKRS